MTFGRSALGNPGGEVRRVRPAAPVCDLPYSVPRRIRGQPHGASETDVGRTSDPVEAGLAGSSNRQKDRGQTPRARRHDAVSSLADVSANHAPVEDFTRFTLVVVAATIA